MTGLVFALLLGTSGCTNLIPSACPPGMSIVTFRGNTDLDPPIRICVDHHAASRRDASETSPGRDNSLPISQSGVIPWTNLTFHDASLACGRAGKGLCTGQALRAIGPDPTDIAPRYISALRPTAQTREVPDQFVELVVPPMRGAFFYPETTASIAFWEAEGRVFGRLRGALAQTGSEEPAPVFDRELRHPLLGFRCCIDARLADAYPPLSPNPDLIMPEEDDVPIAR